jgi:hypothetical protein
MPLVVTTSGKTISAPNGYERNWHITASGPGRDRIACRIMSNNLSETSLALTLRYTHQTVDHADFVRDVINGWREYWASILLHKEDWECKLGHRNTGKIPEKFHKDNAASQGLPGPPE